LLSEANGIYLGTTVMTMFLMAHIRLENRWMKYANLNFLDYNKCENLVEFSCPQLTASEKAYNGNK